MEIDKELYKEIKAYCDLNGLKPREYVHKLLKDAFMKDKYGERPRFMVLPLRPEPKVETVPAEVSIEKEEPVIEPPKEETVTEPQPVVVEQETKQEEVKQDKTAIEPKPRKRKLN